METRFLVRKGRSFYEANLPQGEDNLSPTGKRVELTSLLHFGTESSCVSRNRNHKYVVRERYFREALEIGRSNGADYVHVAEPKEIHIEYPFTSDTIFLGIVSLYLKKD